MGAISSQVEAGSGAELRTGSRELGARMRSLLEWERAFLSEQQWNQARNEPGSATALTQGAPTQRQQAGGPGSPEFAVPPTSLPAAPAHRTGSMVAGQLPVAPAIPSGVVRTMPLPVPGMTSAGARIIDADRPSFQMPELRRERAPVNRAAATENPGMVMTVADDVAQIWLRQPGAEPSLGLNAIVRLREILMRAGLKLARVTVNGVPQWCGNETSLMQSDASSGFGTQVDKRI